MKKIAFLILSLLLVTMAGNASNDADSTIAGADRADFVTTSMVVITPGPDIYSVFGHTAIRMECPSKGLDYCFSFETEAGLTGYLSFFAGQSHAGFVPVPTQEFLSEYRKEGRGVRQYALNLTPHEKQELWRALDNDMMEGAHRKFNLIQNNCTSMSMLMLESIMDNEYFAFGKMPEAMYYNNGRGVAWLSRKSPWAQFIFMSFLGSEADDDWQLENKLNPELIIQVLSNTTIKPADNSAEEEQTTDSIGLAQQKQYGVRPALTGATKTLLPQKYFEKPSAVTPTMFFTIILILSAIWCAYRFYRCKRSDKPVHVSRWQSAAGVLIGIVYSFVSLFLLYVTVVSGLFGVHWNWLLIPFNPIPIIIWLVWRHRQWYTRVHYVYAVVLLAFCIIVPWMTTQLLLPHYLMVGAMAVALAAPSRAK